MAIRATLLGTRVQGLLLLGAAAAMISATAVPLEAQQIEVRPIAKFSLPTKFSLQDGTLRVSQRVGFRFGAQMNVRLNERFDVTSAVTYSPGYATVSGSTKRVQVSSGAHSLAGVTAARYWLRPRDLPLAWEVHSGVGLVFGGQPSYMELLDGSTMTASVGTSVRYRFRQLVSLSVRVEQRVLRLQFGDQLAGSSRPFRVAFGVGLPFLDRISIRQMVSSLPF
ncbi:MAG TPA: hypothetical protein VMS62_09545 [Gemmatimonadales bacterium]|nr:hypothetical protein [Gemmatimonadales bacterium]